MSEIKIQLPPKRTESLNTQETSGQKLFKDSKGILTFTVGSLIKQDITANQGKNIIIKECLDSVGEIRTRNQRISLELKSTTGEPMKVAMEIPDPNYIDKDGMTRDETLKYFSKLFTTNPQDVRATDIRISESHTEASGRVFNPDRVIYWENPFRPGRLDYELCLRSPNNGPVTDELIEANMQSENNSDKAANFNNKLRQFVCDTFGFQNPSEN